MAITTRSILLIVVATITLGVVAFQMMNPTDVNNMGAVLEVVVNSSSPRSIVPTTTLSSKNQNEAPPSSPVASTVETTSKPVAATPKTTRSAEAVSQPAGGYSEEFPLTIGHNPDFCKVQPNRTDIDPYKRCPVPGMNNVLYTQHNRWFCAYRDKRALRLRDRICNKGTQEPYRFSTILQIDYTKIPSDRKQAAICWSDIQKQDEPAQCSWTDIPRFYGTPLWWQARALIDFHPSFHRAAERFIHHKLQGEKFVGVHMRRGDYWQHCEKIKKKGIKPWLPFKKTRTLHKGMASCYPNITEVEAALAMIKAKHDAKYIFVGTNVPEELDPIKEKLGIVLLDDPEKLAIGSRRMDALILEMAIMSRGAAFIFNKYSSLSGTVFEMATVAKRATEENVYCW